MCYVCFTCLFCLFWNVSPTQAELFICVFTHRPRHLEECLTLPGVCSTFTDDMNDYQYICCPFLSHCHHYYHHHVTGSNMSNVEQTVMFKGTDIPFCRVHFTTSKSLPSFPVDMGNLRAMVGLPTTNTRQGGSAYS